MLVDALTFVHDLDAGLLRLSSGGRGHIDELERFGVELKCPVTGVELNLNPGTKKGSRRVQCGRLNR